MNNREIDKYLYEQFKVKMPALKSICGTLIGLLYFDSRTKNEEFNKLLNGNFEEVINDLLNDGFLTFLDYKKVCNYLDIINESEKIFSAYSLDDLDLKWHLQFYEYASLCEDDYFKAIWINILVNKVYYHNNFSLKTLDIINRLNVNDMETFRKVIQYCFKQGNKLFLPNYDNYLIHARISKNELVHLNECNLLNNDTFLVQGIKIDKNDHPFFINNKLILKIKTKELDQYLLRIKEFLLTESGNELAIIFKASPNNNDFLRFAAELVSDDNIDIIVNKMIDMGKGNIKVDNNNLLIVKES